MRGKFTAQPGKIKSSVDLPYEMIFRDRVAQMKGIAAAHFKLLSKKHLGLAWKEQD